MTWLRVKGFPGQNESMDWAFLQKATAETTVNQHSPTPPLSVHSSTAHTRYIMLRKNMAIGEQSTLRCKEYLHQAETKRLIRGNFLEDMQKALTGHRRWECCVRCRSFGEHTLTSEDQAKIKAAQACMGIHCQNTWGANWRTFTMKSTVLNHHWIKLRAHRNMTLEKELFYNLCVPSYRLCFPSLDRFSIMSQSSPYIRT